MTEKNDIIMDGESTAVDYKALDPKALADKIAEVLDDKKAYDVKVVRVDDKTSIADYFVLATGRSSTHVKSLAGEVEYKISEGGVDPAHIEGRDGDAWILIDYSNVIVHIFSREAREFYNLDKLYENIG